MQTHVYAHVHKHKHPYVHLCARMCKYCTLSLQQKYLFWHICTHISTTSREQIKRQTEMYPGSFSSVASSSLPAIVLFLLVLLWWDLLHGLNQVPVLIPSLMPSLTPAFAWCQGFHFPGRFKEDCCAVTHHLHQYLSISKT